MKKKILAFLLACTLAVGMAVSPVGTETVWAEDEEDEVVSTLTTSDGKSFFVRKTAKGLIYIDYEDYIEIYGYEGTATEIEIPDTLNKKPVKDIGFGEGTEGISDLTKITIPKTVESMSANAFVECNRLREIVVKDGNTRYESRDGVLYVNDEEDGLTLHTYPAGRDNTEVIIPDGVKKIGYSAFFGYSKLTSVKIPSSVTVIGDEAFSGCSKLTSVKIPSGVTVIGDSAFHGCSGLTSIEIPSSVTDIGVWGTWGTYFIQMNPFSGCSQLKDIKVDGNPSYKSKDGMLYSNDGVLVSYAAGRGDTQVSIPKGITTIGYDVFSGCSKLTNVSIPSSVTFIGTHAFTGCSGLTSVIIPEGVTTIYNYAFQNCGLTSVIIPKSVTLIGMGAFSFGLKDVYYAGTEEQFSKIISSYDKAYWESMNIHYNYVIPADPSDSTTPADTNGKTNQTITAKSITKTYGAKAFKLNAKSSAGAALTYAVADKKVATIDKNGKVTIKGCGITDIKITAKATEKCNKATKTIKLTVKPKKVTFSSVKSTKKKTATVKWKQDKKASGYIIQFATDSKFNKNKVQTTVSKNKTVSTTVKKLKAGKKYYVRVRAYAKSGKTNVQGDWSKVKTVNVKK